MKRLFVLCCFAMALQAAPSYADCLEKLEWAKKVMADYKATSDDDIKNKQLIDDAAVALGNNDNDACEAAILKLTKNLVRN